MSKTRLKKEIEQEIIILDTEIAWRTEKRDKLQNELMELISPFKKGDVIWWGKGQAKRKGKIIDIAEWCADSPKWKVKKIKKDGTDGVEAWVYEFQNPVLLTDNSRITASKSGNE